MQMKGRLEFWEKDGCCLAALDTDAPPPPKGAIINMRQIDYEVVDVDFTIDRLGEFGTTYRRNVYLREVQHAG